MTLKTKLILAINLAAILALLIFSAVNASSMDDCISEPFLLWKINPSKLCSGGEYHLYICESKNRSIFVSTCVSSKVESKNYDIFFPLVIDNTGTILGIPPVP
jgi:hypothetical protein